MCQIAILRGLVVTFNTIFLTAGLFVGGVGVWIRFTKTEFDALLGSLLPVVTYLMMAGGGLVALVALIGCLGAMTDNKKMLTVYFVLLLVIFLIQAAVGVLGFVAHDMLKPVVGKMVMNVVIEKYGYPEHQLVTKAVDFIQQELRCCGYNESSDWVASHYYIDPNTATERGSSLVPRSCCVSMIKDGCDHSYSGPDIFHKGCVDALVEYLQDNLKIVAGIGIAVALFQLAGMVVTIFLCRSKGDDFD